MMLGQEEEFQGPYNSPGQYLGRRVSLRHVRPGDGEFVAGLLSQSSTLAGLPPRADFTSADHLDQRLGPMLSQYLAERRADRGIARGPIGWFAAIRPDLWSGTAQVVGALDAQLQRQGWAFEACLLFARALRSEWALRKIYVEIPSYADERLKALLQQVGTLEACLSDSISYDERRWDMLIYGIPLGSANLETAQ